MMRSLSVYKMLLENMAWSVMLSQLPGLSQFSACHNTMCSEIHPTIHWLPTWGGGQRWGRGVGKWFIVKQGWSGIHFIYKNIARKPWSGASCFINNFNMMICGVFGLQLHDGPIAACLGQSLLANYPSSSPPPPPPPSLLSLLCPSTIPNWTEAHVLGRTL